MLDLKEAKAMREGLAKTSRFLKDKIVPGARAVALIRRRPAPVSA